MNISGQGLNFRKRKHSRRGIVSSILGGISLLAVIFVMAMAYLSYGQVGKYAGVAGFLAFLMAVTGFIYGVRGFYEEEVRLFFPRLGCLINGFLFVVFVAIYTVGW